VQAFALFVVRLAAYAIVLGIAARLADWLWVSRGLGGVGVLAGPHDTALAALAVAPIVLALGFGRLRPVAVFAAGFLIGAALTAPFALARFGG
jgi:hypothetical protein